MSIKKPSSFSPEFAQKANSFETTQLHPADKKMLDMFVTACLALDFDAIKGLHGQYPDIFEKKNPAENIIIDEPEPTPFLERMKELFDQVSLATQDLQVIDRACTGCSWGGWTKGFVVTDKHDPNRQTHFGFLIQIEGNRIAEIFECSQYKMYQDKLSKRMFKGMSEEEIAEEREAAMRLPDVRERREPF